MFRPRTLLFILIPFLLLGWFSTSGYLEKTTATRAAVSPGQHMLPARLAEKMQAKAAEAKTFAEENDFNRSVCFLVDMSMPSGQGRFFVYDLQKDSSRMAGLVTHGSCNQDWLEGRKYGNTPGCGCTSLGKYRIGNSYNGRFGLAFKLYGLDKTNSNAFNRFIVLHSHACVPATETKEDICQSLGCPTVAPEFLQQLKTIIIASKKPVLLWIYE